MTSQNLSKIGVLKLVAVIKSQENLILRISFLNIEVCVCFHILNPRLGWVNCDLDYITGFMVKCSALFSETCCMRNATDRSRNANVDDLNEVIKHVSF